MKSIPYPGDKATFIANWPLAHWFIDVTENGKKLELGKTYTITKVNVFSSWTSVCLAEFGDLRFNSTWFEYE